MVLYNCIVATVYHLCFNITVDILVNMLKKEKKRVKDAALQLERMGQKPPSSARGEGFSERLGSTEHFKFSMFRDLVFYLNKKLPPG